jgi:hypothetical protein
MEWKISERTRQYVNHGTMAVSSMTGHDEIRYVAPESGSYEDCSGKPVLFVIVDLSYRDNE